MDQWLRGSYTSKSAGQQLNHEIFQKTVIESLLVQNGEKDMIRSAILYKYTHHADPNSLQHAAHRKRTGNDWWVIHGLLRLRLNWPEHLPKRVFRLISTFLRTVRCIVYTQNPMVSVMVMS